MDLLQTASVRVHNGHLQAFLKNAVASKQYQLDRLSVLAGAWLSLVRLRGAPEAGHRLLRQEAGQGVVGVVVFSQVNIINHHWGVSFSAYPPRRVLCVNGEGSEIEIEIVIEGEIERDMDWIGLEVVCWFTQAGVCVYTGRSCPLRMEAFTQEVFVGSVYKEV